MPISHPRALPRITPVLAPVVAPSGAFVFFSCAKSRVPALSGNSTEISVFLNPSDFNSLTPISTLMIEGYSPKTAVFFSAMQTPPLIKIVSA